VTRDSGLDGLKSGKERDCQQRHPDKRKSEAMRMTDRLIDTLVA
jgi:hypothetical protein